jgi:hypothetical protein
VYGKRFENSAALTLDEVDWWVDEEEERARK